MNTELFTMIDNLRAKRITVAGHNRSLGTLDVERKKLQVAIAAEYRSMENPATGKPYSEQASSDLARTDSRYVTMIHAIVEETHERDVALADAEALRLCVELELAASRSLQGVAA